MVVPLSYEDTLVCRGCLWIPFPWSSSDLRSESGLGNLILTETVPVRTGSKGCQGILSYGQLPRWDLVGEAERL